MASTGATFDPAGVFGHEVYFDSLTMFVFFLLSGRMLELRLRDRTAGALEALSRRLPDSVERRQPDGSFEFPPDTVSVMRGTRLGNPFWVGQRLGVAIDLLGAEAVAKVVPSLERAHPLAGDECLELYRLHLWIKIHHEQDRGVLAAMRQIGPKSKLCCACLRPDGTGFCHAQIVVRAWRHLNGRGQPDAPDRSKPRKTEGAPAAAASPSGAREHVGPSSQGAPPHSSR